MTTSGTVAQTQFDAETMISYALQRCGKLPSSISGNVLSQSRNALYLILSDLANEGINLWCLTKSVINVVPNQSAYQMPIGTNDVTNALYRTLWGYPQIVTVTTDAYTVQLDEARAINNVTGTFDQEGSASLAIEWSLDGLTWELLYELSPIAVMEYATFVVDLDSTKDAQYWRIRDTSGVLLPLSNVLFRKTNQEVTMSGMNRDDYTNLPNKQYPGQKALQYWFDKQIEPRLWVWPVSNQPLDQLVIWSAIQIQDVGALTNNLAIPTRWYKAITEKLAYDVSFLIPPAELPPGRQEMLKLTSLESMRSANAGENDGSRWQVAPRISSYTR